MPYKAATGNGTYDSGDFTTPASTRQWRSPIGRLVRAGQEQSPCGRHGGRASAPRSNDWSAGARSGRAFRFENERRRWQSSPDRSDYGTRLPRRSPIYSPPGSAFPFQRIRMLKGDPRREVDGGGTGGSKRNDSQRGNAA